jgi:RNA polymerase sigma-70 factor (ECF subfamily)
MGSAVVSSNREGLIPEEISYPSKSLSTEDQVMDLFTEMRSPVMRHLIWLNLRPDQAEDVVQETFLRLHQHLSRSGLSNQNLRGWIWRVAHNLGIDVRVAANRTENGVELAIDDVSLWLTDGRPNPEQALQQQQHERRMAVGIQRLNARDKQCVHLRAQGLGYRQIASVLGIGRSTVADTMSRVTLLLRSYTLLS